MTGCMKPCEETEIDKGKQKQIVDFFYKRKGHFLHYLANFLGNYSDAEDVIGEVGLKLALT